MKKNSLSRSVMIAVAGASLLLGCGCGAQGGGAKAGSSSTPSSVGSTPGASVSPGKPSEAFVKATPGKVDKTEVKAGDGAIVDGAGGISAEIKLWSDKFDGKPFGRGTMSMTLVPGVTELPGLLNGIKGMKKGGVRRIAIAASDLFKTIPAGAPIQPDQAFFIEAKILDVYPKENFDITTVTPGAGDKAAAAGDPLRVHYVGKLDGFDSETVFDSSRERGTPFVVELGRGQVIPGWDKGLEGMKKGEVRRLSIPHYMAYGDKAQGEKIPAKSRLFFEVELLDFVAPGELKQTVKQEGDGDAIAAGQTGNFHYTGWSDGFDGKAKFDSSKDRGQPIKVQLGAGQVIKGWDQGLVGMKPGEVRLLEIPYNLAYGESGKPPTIPAYATLFFEVEYVGLDAAKATPSPTPRG